MQVTGSCFILMAQVTFANRPLVIIPPQAHRPVAIKYASQERGNVGFG